MRMVCVRDICVRYVGSCDVCVVCGVFFFVWFFFWYVESSDMCVCVVCGMRVGVCVRVGVSVSVCVGVYVICVVCMRV